MKRIILLGFFIQCVLFMQAQEVRFNGSASKTKVAVGEQFRLTYSINTSASGFNGPDLSAFDVYSGPNQNTSMQIINNAVSQTLSYYYILAPRKEGKFTFTPAQINVANGRVRSNEVSIEVVKGNPAQTTNPNPANPRQNVNPGTNQPSTAGASDKLFIKAILNKSSAFLDEQVEVTYKIYSKYGQINFSDLKLPTFNGFYTEDIKSQNNDKLEVENYNGSQYYTAEIKKTLLFPQKSGKLEIPALDATCLVRERVNSQSFFDQFFGGGYRDVSVKVKSQPMSIQVFAHPGSARPADFNGAVGDFTVTAEIDKDKVRSGDPVNLKFTISGKGNLKLLEAPALTFPPEFEGYDPQIKDQIRVTEAGMSGSRTFEYLLIPRAGGEYVLGPFTYTYFSPTKKNYVTTTLPRMLIHVDKTVGDQTNVARSGSGTAPKQLATDIRFNKKNTHAFEPIDEHPFFLSGGFYALTALPPLSLLLLLFMRRRQADRSANSGLYRMKEAGSMAQKRLKKADELLKADKKDAFYEEVYRALYGYLSDKLQIPAAELARPKIMQELGKRQVPEFDCNELIRLLDACEFARFAPGASSGMQQVFTDSVSLLTRTEKYLKS
ncbi:MAG TPA: BatD family protein [Flavobacteriales bacterium]|nr:BatD family protein [Flavobacteriales bacterium]HPH82932.1 BatD family protein [Flavobacteriales bacterium]